MPTYEILIFPSRLGWMALVATVARTLQVSSVGNGTRRAPATVTTVKQLTFGHRTAAAAKAALDPDLVAGVLPGKAPSPLAVRLQAYAEGTPDDFADVQIEFAPAGEFQRSVLRQCRRVKYGSTISYAELAAKAGYPGAARAVGNCMAANRVPLIIPCHRVVCADGRVGSYSAEGGTKMKRRLLALESAK